jgi:nucleoside 2-deoxyribosyltransferase
VKPTVYLAGPITGASYGEATEWRSLVIAALPRADVFSPMRAKDYLVGRESMADSYAEFALSTPKAVVTRDRFDSTRCDLLFANLLGAERVSIGTVMEIAWADARRTPIVLVMEDNGLHDHAMLREVAGWVVPTVDAAIGITNAVLFP